MNGAEPESFDELDEILESDELETDEAVADAESEAEFLPFPPFLPSPFGRSRSPRTARGTEYFRPRPMGNFVTQPQLQSALTKVRNDVKVNATAIKAVNGRVNALQTRHSREIAKQAKTNVQQSRQITTIRNDLKKTRDMNLIMFLLTRPKTSDTTTSAATLGGVSIPANSKFLIEPADSKGLLLPLLLMGGLGGDGGDSNMLFLMLALSDAL